MNRNKKNQINPIIAEMEGFKELGMHKESVRLAIKILKSNKLDAPSFNSALDAIFLGDKEFKTYKAIVYSAYERLPESEKSKSVKATMFQFAWTIHDHQQTQEFVPEEAEDALTLYAAIEVYFKNKQFGKAQPFLIQAEWILNKHSEQLKGCEKTLLQTALAEYEQRVGNLENAEKYWLESLKLNEPFFSNAAEGLIKIQAAKAWVHFFNTMALIKKFRIEGDPVQEITLPGNHQKLLDQATKKLLRYKKALAKILPEKELPDYGIKETII